MVTLLRPLTVFILVCIIFHTNGAWNLLGADGIITKIIESLPGGGYITMIFHARAGDVSHVLQAAVAGFGTLAALAIGGPPGAFAVGLGVAIASLTSVITQLEKEGHIRRRRSVYGTHNRTWSPEEAAGLVVEFVNTAGRLPLMFDELHISSSKKRETLRAVEAGRFTQAGIVLLEAIQEQVSADTMVLTSPRRRKRDSRGRNRLSAESGGKKSIKSFHGTYLRAIERRWKVEMVRGQAADLDNWYIEDLGGKVAIKARGGPNKPGQFLQANRDGSVDLSDKNPHFFPHLIWKPFKNHGGTWSFLSVHGTWLSARDDGSVQTVVKWNSWETFKLEWW